MPLSPEIKLASYKSLADQYANQLNESDLQLLNLINDFAAENDVALHLQDLNIRDLLIGTIKDSESAPHEDLAETAQLIYGLVIDEMAANTQVNRKRHQAQGRFDQTALHLRSPKDQMQDHDMTALMPQSIGIISVMAVLNQQDAADSTEAIQSVLASEIFANDDIQHIIIPVGPGHWRAVYLTKPTGDSSVYELELFDPYGPQGARAIEEFVLNLLEGCGVNRSLVRIRHTGPLLPQGDAYSCGDFTCAHGHKKMKEFGAPEHSYNQILIDTLDNFGNEEDVLRMTSREEIRLLQEGAAVHSPHIIPITTTIVSSNSEYPVTHNAIASSNVALTASVTSNEALDHTALSESHIKPSDRLPESHTESSDITLHEMLADNSSSTENDYIQPAKKMKQESTQATPVSANRTVKHNPLSPSARFAIELGGIAGGSLIGGVIGGLIGFFALPMIGAFVGAAVGTFIGALISAITAGLGRLIRGGNSLTNNETQQKPNTLSEVSSISNTYRKSPQQDRIRDQEPFISPRLFPESTTKIPETESHSSEHAKSRPK